MERLIPGRTKSLPVVQPELQEHNKGLRLAATKFCCHVLLQLKKKQLGTWKINCWLATGVPLGAHPPPLMETGRSAGKVTSPDVEDLTPNALIFRGAEQVGTSR